MITVLPFLLVAQGPKSSLDPTFGRAIQKRIAEKRPVQDAAWIWAEQTRDNQTLFARKTFRLSKAPRRAMLYVTADNEFAAFVNGNEVGKTPADPSDRELWKRVQAIDVTGLVKAGTNVVAVRAVNAGDAAGLVARLEIDGKLAVATDKSWKVSEGSLASGWAEPSYEDGAWVGATEEGRVGKGPWGGNLQGWPVSLATTPEYLSHMDIAPVRWAYAGDPDALQWHPATSRLSVARPTRAGNSWRVVLDFGKELTGRVVVEGASGLTLGTGESTGEALNRPWTTTQGLASPNTALRYATITVPAGEDRIALKVRMDHIYYPVQYRGSFDCSDPFLTKVWYTGAYTAHLCMQDEIWDAPKRDRWRWMGDLHVSGEVINNVFADRFLMERTMSLLRQDAQGSLRQTDLPKGHINGIPGYSYSWVAGLADYYRHFGGRAYLQSQHDALVSMLEFCLGDIDPDGGFANRHKAWVFVDWSPELGQESPAGRATTQLFLYKALADGAFLLGELGDQGNASKFAAAAERVKEASQSRLVTSTGAFGDRKQENAMAIYSGVATAAQASKIFDSGLFKPGAQPAELNVSPYYGNYVLHAMGMAGKTQEGLDYVRCYYGQMIRDGATTFYEHYEPSWDKHDFHSHLQWGENDNAAAGYHVSLCHGWSAGSTTFLTEYILGVQPTGAGFRTCTISPRLGDLKWASGVVPTPSGEIAVRVERKAGGLVLRVKIPKGTKARISLPSSVSTVDGRPSEGASVSVGAGSHMIAGS